MKHSPLPWRVNVDSALPLTLRDIVDANGAAVCEFCADEDADEANADLIVHRVNLFDEVLAALKQCLKEYREQLDSEVVDRTTAGIVAPFEAVIAKAEGR